MLKPIMDSTGEALTTPLFSVNGNPIQSNAVSKAARRALQFFDEPWTPHDLRRTVASKMASQGTLPHVIEEVLNHASGYKKGVAGIYNRHDYITEKRRALNLWAAFLDDLVKDKNPLIIPIKLARS